MHDVQHSPPVSISDARGRSRRMREAIQVRRSLTTVRGTGSGRPRGRAWLNGVEIGHPIRSLGYLEQSYD